MRKKGFVDRKRSAGCRSSNGAKRTQTMPSFSTLAQMLDLLCCPLTGQTCRRPAKDKSKINHLR
jgi:hypothetical protein